MWTIRWAYLGSWSAKSQPRFGSPLITMPFLFQVITDSPCISCGFWPERFLLTIFGKYRSSCTLIGYYYRSSHGLDINMWCVGAGRGCEFTAMTGKVYGVEAWGLASKQPFVVLSSLGLVICLQNDLQSFYLQSGLCAVLTFFMSFHRPSDVSYIASENK